MTAEFAFGRETGKGRGRVGCHSFRGEQLGRHAGQPDGARSPQPEGVAAIDPVDSVVFGSAVGKRRQNEDAGHEADRLGLSLEVLALGSRRPQCPGPVPDFVSHS